MRISKKLFLMNSSIIIFVLGLVFLSTRVYFQRYYVNQKTNQLKEISEYIKNPSSQSGLEEIEDRYRVRVDFLDMEEEELFYYNGFLREIYGEDFTKENISKALAENGEIIQLRKDKRTGLDLLSYMSLYEKGILMIVSSPIYPMQEAVKYSEKFYLYILLLALALSFAINYFFSKIFTNPLTALTEISRNMANLSFQKKADIKTGDEVEELAEGINYMSEKLDDTIKKLEDSNIKLKKEIEKERILEKFRKDFISSVNHELKTPIALISGYAEGLKDGVADEESRDFYCQVIMDEANRMNIMVKDLLLISQIESGYFKMSKSSLDISGILESCLHRFEILIKEKGLKVSNDLGETIIVSANKDGIEKVLNNLLSNAVKYCQEGGKIKIGVEEHREKVKVFIYNSSNKIAMGELDKIWTPFYKLDKSGSKKYGGTGLGLAIVKEILEKHGSEYGVDLLEDGLEFYFYLEKNRETTDY